MFEPGDIILRKRKPYKGPFKYLITRLILFFTTAWWKKEKTSKHYHAEMVWGFSHELDQWMAVTMEPPECRVERMPSTYILVFRLKIKPPNFDDVFEKYVLEKLGQRYDFIRFLWMWLYWLTMEWNWLGLLYENPDKDICSEFVARFYEERVGIPCSPVDSNLTTPDDIYDFLVNHPSFMVVANVSGD